MLLPTVNDVQDAVRSVSSYMLFDPGDTVMQQNLVYYRFHRERWRLREEDFEPRPVRTPPSPVSRGSGGDRGTDPGLAPCCAQEAVRYHNQTATQKMMLDFARQYLQADDEVNGGHALGCGRVLWVPLGRAFTQAGGSDPQTSPGAPMPPPAHPTLQMEVDGDEGLEVRDLPSDGEFEGEGDYEEGFFSEWWQEPRTKGDKAEQGL